MTTETPWIAIKRANKDQPCHIPHSPECHNIKKGELYEYHNRPDQTEYGVCRKCTINPELFKPGKPLTYRDAISLFLLSTSPTPV